MNINDLAEDYMEEYCGTGVVVTETRTFSFDDVIAFDLSDGTHWFEDANNTGQTEEKLTDVCDIAYDEYEGWVIVDSESNRHEINWIEY